MTDNGFEDKENENKETADFVEWCNNIANTMQFKELDKFLRISDYPGKALPTKLWYYLEEQYTHDFPAISNSDARKFFRNFFEAYKKKESKIYFDKNGYIDLSKTLYLKQHLGYAGNHGFFTSGWYIFSDGNKYLSKIPLNYMSYQSDIEDENCIYNPIIAEGIAKKIGVDSAKYFIGMYREGIFRVLSKNFLKSNDELINFLKFNAFDYNISDILEELESKLLLRKFPKEQIETIKFEFLKQEFLAKLIGLSDQKGDNSALIFSVDEEGKKSVRLAPMYDYDFSFHMQKGKEFRSRESDNGRIDIASFIEQYRNYPGFLDFVKKSVETLNMEDVYEDIYKSKGLDFFKNHRENPVLTEEYTKFVNHNLDIVKNILKKIEKRKEKIAELYEY